MKKPRSRVISEKQACSLPLGPACARYLTSNGVTIITVYPVLETGDVLTRWPGRTPAEPDRFWLTEGWWFTLFVLDHAYTLLPVDEPVRR